MAKGILRASAHLLASSSPIPCRSPAAANAHLCKAANHHHPVWFIPSNIALSSAKQNQQHFVISASSSRRLSTGWIPRRQSLIGAYSLSSSLWTRVVCPVVSLIGGGSDSRNSLSSSSLLNFSDQQDRPYATGGPRRHQPAGAGAAVCFSGVGGRRMPSGVGGRRTSSGNRFVRAFAEDAQSGGVGAPLTDVEKDKFKGVEIKQTKKLLTLPTILTLARVAAVPAILAVFYSKEPWATSAGTVIFVLAALTDWLDGYLARKMGTSSAFGAFLDPVADKLMVAAALVLLCTKPLAIGDLSSIPWLLPVPTIAIIGREITMSAVREWAAAQGGDLHKAVAVNSLGKIKTASQMVAITLLLACGEGGLDSTLAGVVGVGLLYVAAILALWSLGIYMRGIWGSMLK
ncbi:unnamed protein product [Calypogeia fissa]